MWGRSSDLPRSRGATRALLRGVMRGPDRPPPQADKSKVCPYAAPAAPPSYLASNVGAGLKPARCRPRHSDLSC